MAHARTPRLNQRVPGVETRALPRVGADFPVNLFASDFPGPLEGRARDLGLGGMCVATPSPFAFKSLLGVGISLPDGRIEIEAEGRWQRSAPGDEVVLTGISFRQPDADVTSTLWDLVLDSAKEIARFLHSGSDFAELGLDEAMGLAQVTRYRDVSAGAQIYRQDECEPGEDSIFLITRGRVVLQVRVRDAREVPIDQLGSGRLLGGLPMLTGTPPTESAVAETDVRLLEIDRRAYGYLLTAKPWLAQRLAQTVVEAVAHRAHDLAIRSRDGI